MIVPLARFAMSIQISFTFNSLFSANPTSPFKSGCSNGLFLFNHQMAFVPISIVQYNTAMDLSCIRFNCLQMNRVHSAVLCERRYIAGHESRG